MRATEDDHGDARRRRGWVLLVGPLALATALFVWHLGSPSLYIDEVYSWRAASRPVGELLHRVRFDEVAPPTYYLLLHEWTGRLGSSSETVMRLPSVFAGLGVVAAVFWLGRLAAGRAAGLVATVLAALSPLLLEYAQQVRAYVWAMLGVVVAVACLLRASSAVAVATRRRWLAGGAAAAIGAIWFHYTAGLVIAPLATWLLIQSAMPLRERLVVTGTVALGAALLLPLMSHQLSRGHQSGAAAGARPTGSNFIRVFGTPFDGRFADHTALVAAATVALLLAVTCVIGLHRPGFRSAEGLMLACGLVAPSAW